MPTSALLDDALRRTADGCTLRLSLPWIRSLPVACLSELQLRIDGAEAPDLAVDLGAETVRPSELQRLDHWWYVQDRLALVSTHPLSAAPAHTVEVAFRLLIPYLPGGPDTPLTLPFRFTRELPALAADAPGPAAARDLSQTTTGSPL